jgi:hypothetical protein
MTSRELDVLVAEHVMGLNPIRNDGSWVFTSRREWVPDGDYYFEGVDSEGYHVTDEVPAYSTDIADAWLVFMRFADTYKVLSHVQLMSLGWTLGQPLVWRCTIGATNTATADTAPMAICLAALKCVDVEVPE